MTNLIYTIENRIGFITLNRPDKRNALNAQTVLEMTQILLEAENNDALRAIIIKANGNTFCSGADLEQIKAMQSATYDENLADSLKLKTLFEKIYTHKKIVIAQVEGYALAGGCGLASVCDFTFCTPESKFGYTEARIGFIPALVMVFLIRKIGEKRAGQLLLTADIISADDALSLGLVNQIFSSAQIGKMVLDFTNKLITQNSAQSLAATKALMAQVQAMPLSEALDYAARQNADARATTDCRRGIEAFLNKQSMQW